MSSVLLARVRAGKVTSNRTRVPCHYMVAMNPAVGSGEKPVSAHGASGLVRVEIDLAQEKHCAAVRTSRIMCNTTACETARTGAGIEQAKICVGGVHAGIGVRVFLFSFSARHHTSPISA